MFEMLKITICFSHIFAAKKLSHSAFNSRFFHFFYILTEKRKQKNFPYGRVVVVERLLSTPEDHGFSSKPVSVKLEIYWWELFISKRRHS